jgi:hypothetical protein
MRRILRLAASSASHFPLGVGVGFTDANRKQPMSANSFSGSAACEAARNGATRPSRGLSLASMLSHADTLETVTATPHRIGDRPTPLSRVLAQAGLIRPANNIGCWGDLPPENGFRPRLYGPPRDANGQVLSGGQSVWVHFGGDSSKRGKTAPFGQGSKEDFQ